jgi:uncharacterized membrane protein
MRRLWLPLLMVALRLPPHSGADEPARRYQVVSPKDDGIVATGINGRGEIVGFEWVEEKAHPGVLIEAPIYVRGKQITHLGTLKGYTATFPAAVSDDGLIVGRASKPASPLVRVHLRNQAFVWDARAGMRGLGVLEGDTASAACGITRDGRRICGWSLGDERMRPCLWERDGDGWKTTALPHRAQLGSPTVAISDDGKYVAGTDGLVACLWSQAVDGRWTRQVISRPGFLAPRSVNNSGMVVGVRHDLDGLTHAVIRPREGGYKQLQEPKGYVKSEANAVNNEGVVVGLIDGPGGSKIGPNAFVYEGGRLRVLEEGGPSFTAATAINDHGQVAGVFEKEEDELPADAGKASKRK